MTNLRTRKQCADYEIDNTNSRHLELYTVLGEFDNAGFPLSYCLLTTASSLEDRKRTRALEAWVAVLRDEYGVIPRFVHTDKDMAEIGASRRVWPEAKHQLCWWHQREALRRRLKGNLPTSIYNAQRARREHPFIDLTFTPFGRADPNDCEGRVPGEICEQEDSKAMPLTGTDPNSIKIRIPPFTSQGTHDLEGAEDSAGGLMLQVSNSLLGLSGSTAPLVTGDRDWVPLAVAEPRAPTDNSKLTIRIPPLSTIRETRPIEAEPDPDEETTPGRRTFCPIEYRAAVVELMERHFCAHPLIPGYSAPTPEGIKAWAVKQAYDFCVLHELPNLWAYLWENWYRRGRWELWARSGNPKEIPRLKTMMFVEGQ